MNLLMIGCGAIGSTIAAYAQNNREIENVYLYDRLTEKVRYLSRLYSKCRVAESVSSCLKKVHLVVEAASQEAVREYALMSVREGKDILIMSVGALEDDELRSSLEREALMRDVRVIIPSGACGGLDALLSAGYDTITSVKLTTIKPPEGLSGAPYVKENKINLSTIEKRTIIFTGNARDAIRWFPANVNIAATVSLCGIGFDRTVVEVVCDPFAKRNIHILEVKGEFGEFRCEFSNTPFPANPRTSYLAALSAIKCVSRGRGKGITVI